MLRPGIREARPQAVPPPADLLLPSIVGGLKKFVSGQAEERYRHGQEGEARAGEEPRPQAAGEWPGPAIAATRVATTPRPHALPSWNEVLPSRRIP
jgi:hypothetical protein